ncbi:MAG: RNA-guided endonuclease TnpB family protein [Candidatus Thermoplasmatota archaeon]|nr:RNA-guided endonuclease TnpB family protein [Candidatus Thermoplasmatota archaeon]MCL6089457.1 RNA-guided endonuclease TnpB family protein [Candidatus Thermoplasmatota archaeon]
MLKTLQIKLLPNDAQREALIDTFVQFNGACNFVSGIAFERRLFNKVFLQRIVYRDIRERFGLASQLAVRVIAKVVETYKTDKTVFHEFRDYGSIVYDPRIMSFKGLDQVSINTVHGRIRIPITIGKYGKIPFQRIRGQCDLIRKNKIFYIMVAIDVPDEPAIKPKDIIGVDMGIENIAVDSTGKYYSGDDIREVRERNADLRDRLQYVGTKSAKKHLKKLSGKESRFARNTNHTILKEIVQKARGTSSAIAIEDLSGIRKRTTVRKGNRYIHNSWAFYQLRLFIEYKAREAGIPVIVVDPHNTSRECPECHTIDRGNRPERSKFKCISCGLEGEADFIASLNIRNRAAVNQPIVTGAIFDHSILPVASSKALARSC